MNPTITVIMPSLNEEKNISSAIRNTLRAFDDLKVSGELVVVNDGSKDKTEEIVRSLMAKEKDRLRIISHKECEGIGKSFWDGVTEARNEIVAMFPGDNENDPWEALRYLTLLQHVDIVIPFVFNRGIRPFYRNMLSSMYRWIINTTFFVTFNYTNGTVLYRKSILLELPYRSKSFFFQTDILTRLVKQKYLFAEVPYRLGLRQTGISSAVSWPSLFKVCSGYMRLVRDTYFDDKERQRRYHFSADSVSERRQVGK